MNQTDLKPAYALAAQLGVKSVCYGPPGSGKTPLFATAPKPVLCVVEPGMLSMRGTNIACYDAYTASRIDEFMAWLTGSAEAAQFDTVGVDSVSQMAEIYLTDELGKHKDGRKAYGEMSIRMMKHMNALYFMQNKHIVLIAKEGTVDENGIAKRRPFFPGQDLNVKVPHLFDLIMQLGLHTIPGVQGAQRALRCRESFDAKARDRSGKLAEFEPPNLTSLFAKAMSN